MNDKNNILLTAFAALMAFSGAVSAQQNQGYSYAYIRYLDGNVEVQRATEAEPAEAGINLPIQSGDRAWTHANARAELEYGDGSILRMDGQTRIDFVDFGEQGSETLVRLWSGSIILQLPEERAKSFRVDTPAGTIYPASAGTFRIDVYDGGESVVLSVYEGVAELASEGGSTLVRSGQRSIVEPGRRPESSFSFNTARLDDFLAWNEERDRQYAVTENIEGIPPEVGGYTGALSHHGTWRVDVQLGSVWYPSVSVGWYPYSQGRWVYSAYGWTWASYEPWGWAPYHYGRWGYNNIGWYWIPGAHWGPAWVSWAIGPSWIGWSPLGYYDRPVHHYDRIWYRGGKAVPRGGASGTRGHGWNFTRTADFGRRSSSTARLRTADIQSTSRQAQLLESGAVLDRGLKPRVVGAAAMTRMPRGGLSAISRTSGSSGNAETSGTLQTGRARSRTATSATPQVAVGASPKETKRTTRPSGQTIPRGSTSELRQGDPRTSSSVDGNRSQSGPGTTPQVTGGASPQETERATQRSRVTPRPQTSRSTDDSRIRSTVRGMFRDSEASKATQPTTRGRSSVQQRSEPQQSSRTERSTKAPQPRRDQTQSQPSSRDRSSVQRRFEPRPSPRAERSTGTSQPSRGQTRSLRTPPSRTQTEPSRQSGSERGRSFFSRITKSRPQVAPSRTSPRDRPSAAQPSRPSGSRPPKASQPSRSSGSKSSGRASSTRGRAKPRKKN